MTILFYCTNPTVKKLRQRIKRITLCWLYEEKKKKKKNEPTVKPPNLTHNVGD